MAELAQASSVMTVRMMKQRRVICSVDSSAAVNERRG